MCSSTTLDIIKDSSFVRKAISEKSDFRGRNLSSSLVRHNIKLLISFKLCHFVDYLLKDEKRLTQLDVAPSCLLHLVVVSASYSSKEQDDHVLDLDLYS
jgi:hypothetical protein